MRTVHTVQYTVYVHCSTYCNGTVLYTVLYSVFCGGTVLVLSSVMQKGYTTTVHTLCNSLTG